MKYKVGDKVRIKSREWYDANKNIYGDVDFPYCAFIAAMSAMCGKVYEITDVDTDGTYKANNYWLLEEFIEGLVSEEKPIISTDLIKDIAEVIKTHNLGVSISENEGKLIIEPLKVEEEEDLPIDTPCMVADKLDDWRFRYYAGQARCFIYSLKSNETGDTNNWIYIIPFDKFNPNNPEQSLKYNIVKNNQ